MLECSNCSDVPLHQCNTCNGLKFCDGCLIFHLKFHTSKKTEFNLSPVATKISEEKTIKLIIKVYEYNKLIQKQRKAILKEANKLHIQIKNMVKSSLQELNALENEYIALTQLKMFNPQELSMVDNILNEKLVFRYPSFTAVEGLLTKNSRIVIVKNKMGSSENLDAELLLKERFNAVECAALSQNDKFFAVGCSDSIVRLWNLYEKKIENVFRGHEKTIKSIAIEKYNEFLVSGSEDSTVRIWMLEDESKNLVFKGHTGSVLCVAVDGNYVASGSEDTNILLWNVYKNQLIRKFIGHNEWVTSIYIESEQCISGSRDGSIRLWNMDDRKDLKFDLPQSCNTLIASYSHTFMSTCGKNFLIWRERDKKLTYTVLEGHKEEITCIDVIKNENCALTGSFLDNTIIIWDLDKKCLAKIIKDAPNAFCFRVANRERSLVSISFGSIKFWDIDTKKKELEIWIYTPTITCKAITNDNQTLVTGSTNHSLTVWDLKEKKQRVLFKGHTSEVRKISFSNSNQLIASVSFGEIIIWNIAEKIALINSPLYEVLCFSQNSMKFATVINKNHGALQLWNFEEKQQEVVFKNHYSYVKCIAISNDNSFMVSGSIDRTVRLWNLIEKKQEAIFQGHKEVVTCVSITHNNKYIVSGSNSGEIIVWDIKKRQKASILVGHSKEIKSIAVLTKHSYVISASSDMTIKLWSIRNATLKGSFEGHKNSVNTIAVSNDNALLVSGSDDNSIRLWNISRKRQEKVLEGHTSCVMKVGISKDKKIIVSGSLDNTVRVWNMENYEQIIKIIKSDILAINIFMGNDANKVFITSNVSITTLNISKKKLKQEFIFDENLKRIYNDYLHAQDLISHEIEEND